MQGSDTPPGMVKTADTIFGILESLRATEGATLSEVVDEHDLAKSTIHDHLSTLRAKGYVVKEGEEYRPSLRFLDFGIYVRDTFTVARTVESSLQHLAETTDGFARFFVEEHGEAVCVSEVKGERGVYTSIREGKSFPMHCLAAGKILLAEFTPERQEEILDRLSFTAHTENTITDPTALREELEEARERGYATSDSELLDGVRAVASPVETNGTVYGSVSIAGPTNWMQGEKFTETMPNTVLETSNEIELKIQYGSSAQNPE